MTLAELLRGVRPLRVAGPTGVEIRGLRHDSRQIKPGELFFALPGTKTDGNRFAKKAWALGASAVVSELEPPPAPVALQAPWVQVQDVAEAMGRMADAYYGHPSRAMTVFGVTGTNGKTRTTYFLESIVKACGGVPAVVGTNDYRLSGLFREKPPNTTPISLELLRLLARFRDGGASHVAMEVSSHALALKRVEEVDFDAAIFTNLRRDHLDFHKTPEEYLRAKAHLFELLGKASSTKERRIAVINADDPRAAALRRAAVGSRVLLYGLTEAAEAGVRAESVEMTLSGTRFDILRGGRRLPAEISLLGEYNVYNALAATAAALEVGLPEERVLQGLRELRQVPGRLEPVEEGQDFRVLVDYAHTDSALENVLDAIAKLPHRRLITVFGCGGDRDRTKRGPMGVAACRRSDLAVITSDNPRNEDPMAILAEIEEGVKRSGLKNYKIIVEREAAIREAVSSAETGDILLIAGKGHEDYQILGDRTIHFDDREVARAAIRGR